MFLLKKKTLLLFFVLLSFSLLLIKSPKVKQTFTFKQTSYHIKDSLSDEAKYQAQFASKGKTKLVHCPAIIRLKSGNLQGFWYGGTREGAKDVNIFTAVFHKSSNTWGDEKVLVTRQNIHEDMGRYVKKLGNCSVMRDSDNNIRLFFVSVSLGGWSGSSINTTISMDEGNTWSCPKRLISSPFLNISTLVKGTPFLFADGTIGLPAYHEFIGKFCEILLVNKQSEVIYKMRLSKGRSALQPIILSNNSISATGFFRNGGSPPYKVQMVKTTNGGKIWSKPSFISLANPNSAIAGMVLQYGNMLIVFNNSKNKRDNLSLAYSTDIGQSWHIIHTFEDNKTGQFDYPSMIRDDKGNYHLLFTWNKTLIKHITFNKTWLKQKLLSARL